MWLVIGYGNTLCRDDGFGVVVAEQILARNCGDKVAVLPVHQLKPELMEPISQSMGVIFVDADRKQLPGHFQIVELTTCAELDQPAILEQPVFTHHSTPQQLISGARALYTGTPRAWFYTLGGADFSYGDNLSTTVAVMVPHAVKTILHLIVSSS